MKLNLDKLTEFKTKLRTNKILQKIKGNRAIEVLGD